MSERRPNFLVRSFNIDVLGVMKPPEILVKGIFDAATIVVVGHAAVEAVTGPTPNFLDNIKNAVLALGCDLAINYTNRPYWLRRRHKQ